jgi:Mce-associated membrane protein
VAVPPAPDGDAVGDQSDSTQTTTTEPATDGQPGPRGPLWVLMALFAVVLACLLASLVALGRAGWSVDDLVDEPQNPQTQRDQVMAVARSFVTEFSTYGPEDLDDQNKMPAYVERVEKYLTPKFQTAFEQNVTFAEQSVAQTQISRTGQVYATAVRTLEDDSVRVLVAGTDTVSVPDPKKPEEQVPYGEQPFRYEVDLILTDGEWLVDNFGEVNTLDGVPPEDVPSAPPTTPDDGATTPGGGDEE